MQRWNLWLALHSDQERIGLSAVYEVSFQYYLILMMRIDTLSEAEVKQYDEVE